MNTDLLKLLLENMSVSGEEFMLQEKLKEQMEPFCDNIYNDRIGDGIYEKKGNGGNKILFAAHIDEIGLMVSGFTDKGYVKVTNAGGIQARTYPGHTVKIQSQQKGTIWGSIVNVPKEQKEKDFDVSKLLIDIGADSKAEAEQAVEIGDRAVQDTTVRKLLNNRIAARGLDDRSGVFCIMEALKLAQKDGDLSNTVLCAATAGEEVGAHGAKWVSEKTDPDEAVVIDVTFASDYKGMEDQAWGDVKLGKGPAILINPMCDRQMVKKLRTLAEENEIPYQLEVCSGRSYTDGDEIHTAATGIPTALVSIPLRYMHTPAEVVDLDDLNNTIKLLSLYMNAK